MERERRFVPNAEARVSLTEGESGPRLEGRGIVFNSWSEDLGGFIERILPEAVEDVLEASDIRGAFNHDANHILGRVKSGTMRLQTTPEGVNYTIDLPDTTAGRDVAVSVSRGDVDGSSFQFSIAEDGDRWDESGGLLRRTIHKFREIYELGPVTFPAYAGTVVSARSLEQARKGLVRDDGRLEAAHAARRRRLEIAERG